MWHNHRRSAAVEVPGWEHFYQFRRWMWSSSIKEKNKAATSVGGEGVMNLRQNGVLNMLLETHHLLVFLFTW